MGLCLGICRFWAAQGCCSLSLYISFGRKRFERHKAAAACPCISASSGRGLSGTRLLQPILVYQLRQEEVLSGTRLLQPILVYQLRQEEVLSGTRLLQPILVHQLRQEEVLSGTRLLQPILVYQLRQEEVSACNDLLHKASVCLSVCATWTVQGLIRSRKHICNSKYLCPYKYINYEYFGPDFLSTCAWFINNK